MPAHPIDWRAVQWVCQGEKLKLSVGEKQMVVRRMSERLLGSRESVWATAVGKVTLDDLAERMHTTSRSVMRMRDSLKPATRRRCLICRQDMWVLDDGTVEAHPTSMFDQCCLSGGKWEAIA